MYIFARLYRKIGKITFKGLLKIFCFKNLKLSFYKTLGLGKVSASNIYTITILESPTPSWTNRELD